MLVPLLVVAVFVLALVLQRGYYVAVLRRHRKLFERSVAGLYRADANGILLEANEALSRICGVAGESEVLGRRFRDFFLDQDELAVMEDVRSNDMNVKQTCRLTRRDGRVVWVVWSAFLVSLPGDPPEIEGSMVDISGQKQAEEKIELLANAVESSRDMITITGLDDCFTFANQAFLDEYGFAHHEILGAHISAIDSPSNPPEVRQSIFEGTRTGAWSGELVNRRRNGTEFPIALSTSQIRDRNGDVLGLVGVATNITEKKQRELRVEYEAYHDALTSLPNRRLFIDRLAVALAQAQRRGRSLAVMFIDLDRFKRINDTLGHPVGDGLLIAVATRLSLIVRSGDTMARVGGDEFMFLAPDIHEPADASRLALKILDGFEEPFELEEHELFVSASIGVALYPGDGADAETLIKNADLAMYRAKDLGRERYEFSSPATRTEVALEHLNLENGLRRALHRGELVPYFQPQVKVRTGEVVGAEALLRWNHPERGLLSAHEFIHIAEEANLIGEMDEHVLREAIRQLAEWQREMSSTFRVAVNISARQFLDRDLPHIVRDALSSSSLDPQTLELEITETLAMRDIDETVRVLREVKDLGVRVAIDDFGIGHSSLNYLRTFPVDSVKIDRSFIRDLTTNPQDAEITSSIIGMAHRLGLNTIAEGVETPEQQMILDRYGCDHMQGHLVQPALPAEAFAGWSTARAKRV
ncbi:MAG TPA: EAL domain-containing protein [Thermoanaerobaculia bacterium]